MSDISSLIVGSGKITSIFGEWPSFHDAEVHELHFHRGHIDTTVDLYEFPHLTAKLQVGFIAKDVEGTGYFPVPNHILVTIKFSTVDDFKMEGFNHQNAIFELFIEQKTRDEGPTPYFVVEFVQAFGVAATFTCLNVEVLETAPCDREGNPS